MNDNFDTFMERTKPTLTEQERAGLFSRIEAATQKTPVVSPYVAWIHISSMARLMALLLIVVATTGTVLASDAARPGDLLFPVERVREETQLLLAPLEKKSSLKEQFAKERLDELKEIVDEEGGGHRSEVSPRVLDAIVVVEQYLNAVEDESRRDDLRETLKSQLPSLGVSDDEEVQIKVDDNKIEIRSNTERIEIRDDGERRVKYEDDNSKTEYRERDFDEDDLSTDGYRIKKFEVRVEGNRAEVRLEYGGVKDEYETAYISDEDIVVEAAGRSGLPIEELLLSLDIEYDD